MRPIYIYILFLFVLISSCEGIIHGKGKIISASNKLPIDSVRINWFNEVIYSDKNGNFLLERFVGCVPSCPEIKLVLNKQGYEPKYINLTKENEANKTVFELMPNNDKGTDFSRDKSKQLLFYLSIATALISLFTLIMLASINLKHKLVWLVIILFGTFSFYYNYLVKTTELKIFRPSLFVFIKYTFEPSWYQLNLPIGLIIFWIYYFTQVKNKARK